MNSYVFVFGLILVVVVGMNGIEAATFWQLSDTHYDPDYTVLFCNFSLTAFLS